MKSVYELKINYPNKNYEQPFSRLSDRGDRARRSEQGKKTEPGVDWGVRASSLLISLSLLPLSFFFFLPLFFSAL